MNQEKAYSIIEALANGIDPSTGECFPDDSPYNNPETIRALFFILRSATINKKPKKSIEEKQQINLQKGLPRNYGLPWTESNVDLVIKSFNSDIAIEEIARMTERKPSSIIGLLKKYSVISEEKAFEMGLLYRSNNV